MRGDIRLRIAALRLIAYGLTCRDSCKHGPEDLCSILDELGAAAGCEGPMPSYEYAEKELKRLVHVST